MQIIVRRNYLARVLVKPLFFTTVPTLPKDLFFSVREVGNILLERVIAKGIQHLVVLVVAFFVLGIDKEFAISLKETRGDAIGGIRSVEIA